MHLDLLSIPQSGGKNVKTFRWDQYCSGGLAAFIFFSKCSTCSSHYLKKNQKPIGPQSYPVLLLYYTWLPIRYVIRGLLDRKRSEEHLQKSCSVCVLSSHLFWTSGLWTYQPGSHRRNATQDFSSTFLLRCLP